MAASVKRCHPNAAWLFASCALTVSVAFSSSTPWRAHRSKFPDVGIVAPVSCAISLKMFCSDGGSATPSCTEKLRPCACPGSW